MSNSFIALAKAEDLIAYTQKPRRKAPWLKRISIVVLINFCWEQCALSAEFSDKLSPSTQLKSITGLEEQTEDTLGQPLTIGLKEKEQLKQRLRSVQEVQATKIWRVTDKGWVLEQVNIDDPTGASWKLTLPEAAPEVPMPGVKPIEIPNAMPLAKKSEMTPVASALAWIDLSQTVQLLRQTTQPSPPPSQIGPLGIKVTEKLYVVPDAIIEAARRVEIGGSDIGTIAIHVEEGAQPLSMYRYVKLLTSLARVDRALYDQLVKMSYPGQDVFNAVYFTPGNILILASRTTDPDGIQRDLGHEIFERALRAAPEEQQGPLRRTYAFLDQDPSFRKGNMGLFGHFTPYLEQIRQGTFAEEFWTWVAWPDFGNPGLDRQFPEAIMRLLDRVEALATPLIAGEIKAARDTFQELKSQSEREAGRAVRQVLAAIPSVGREEGVRISTVEELKQSDDPNALAHWL